MPERDPTRFVSICPPGVRMVAIHAYLDRPDADAKARHRLIPVVALALTRQGTVEPMIQDLDGRIVSTFEAGPYPVQEMWTRVAPWPPEEDEERFADLVDHLTAIVAGPDAAARPDT
jgi:hypothetical protein